MKQKVILFQAWPPLEPPAGTDLCLDFLQPQPSALSLLSML